MQNRTLRVRRGPWGIKKQDPTAVNVIVSRRSVSRRRVPDLCGSGLHGVRLCGVRLYSVRLYGVEHYRLILINWH